MNGNVIPVAFGAEREWQRTRERLVFGLATIGELYGDDAKLMESKAECAYRLLREIVEDVPRVTVKAMLPGTLTPDEMRQVESAIRDAALKGIETALSHAVTALMRSIYDLCTAKLGGAS